MLSHTHTLAPIFHEASASLESVCANTEPYLLVVSTLLMLSTNYVYTMYVQSINSSKPIVSSKRTLILIVVTISNRTVILTVVTIFVRCLEICIPGKLCIQKQRTIVLFELENICLKVAHQSVDLFKQSHRGMSMNNYSLSDDIIVFATLIPPTHRIHSTQSVCRVLSLYTYQLSLLAKI